MCLKGLNVLGYAILGSARVANVGGGLAITGNLALGDKSCLEAGAGLQVVGALGMQQDVFPYRKDALWIQSGEINSSPFARVGWFYAPTPSFQFGLTVDLGVTLVSGYGDIITKRGDVKPAEYDGMGPMVQGMLVLQGNPTPGLGLVLAGGVNSHPGGNLPGDDRSTGAVGHAGLKFMF